MVDKKFNFLVLILFLLFLVNASVIVTTAQSGSTITAIEENLPSETPDNPVDSQVEAMTNPKVTTDKKTEIYRFVYPTSFEGKCYRVKKYPEECFTVGEEAFLQKARFGIENFIGQLNQLGEQNYRLDKINWGPNPVGFVKPDENQYEYAWFETDSRFFSIKNGFSEEIAKFAKRGFRVIEHSLISRNCYEPDKPNSMEICSYVDAYLLEKEKSAIAVPRQLILRSSGGWDGKASVKLTKQINEKLNEGFFPFAISSGFEVMLEQSSVEQPEILAVDSDNEKKVNELSKQGYRLEMINDAVAVMIRRKKNAVPVSYIRLRTNNKNFAAEFAALTGKGAIYHSVYPNEYGQITDLIFEQTNEQNSRVREYKLLELDFLHIEKTDGKRIEVQLKPTAIESLKTADEFMKQGFKIREIFNLDKLTILLER